MTYQYQPDSSSFIERPFNVSFLSQRDVELLIPINYLTVAGVSISAACFANNRYEDYATVKCISNLLETGFRRLDVDIYWDSGRRIWSFCPVSLPSQQDESSGQTITAGTSSSTSLATASTGTSVSQTRNNATATVLAYGHVGARQVGSMVVSNTTSANQTRQTTTPVTTATVVLSTSGTNRLAILPTAIPAPNEEVLFSVGPYTCSGASALEILTELLPNFLEVTDNTLQAVIQTVILNIHAASSITAPLEPAAAPQTTDLPGLDDLMGPYFQGNASTFLYTPSILASDRANLNTSWLSVSENLAPESSYYNTTSGQNNIQMTADGWPSASINEFQGGSHRRLLFGYGNFDPQMAEYDFTGDNATIFPPGYLTNQTTVVFNGAGSIESGCIYNPFSTTISSANTSWALSAIPPSTLDPNDTSLYVANASLSFLSNLVSCGISPFLNTTLLNTTADINISPYKHFVYSSIWSWAWNQPVSDTSLTCAVLDPTIPAGRWRVADCSENHRAACRVAHVPLSWTIGTDVDVYDQVSCPTNTSFSVPHTALENRYLYEAYMRTSSGNATEPLWINLNSLSVQDCWVSGVNATCPYLLGDNNAAQIYVPTVAGVIILVITVLLILVKCGANRVHSKRKRRLDDSWDYEGIPS